MIESRVIGVIIGFILSNHWSRGKQNRPVAYAYPIDSNPRPPGAELMQPARKSR